ncbi:MAG: transcription termination factor NusA [Patescibacteria group bacterium]
MDLKTLNTAVRQIAEEKNIEADQVLAAIEDAIAAAYKKEYEKRGEIIKAKFDAKSGDVKFWQVKTIVDETTVDIVEPEEELNSHPEHREGSLKDSSPTVQNDKGEDSEKLPRYNPDRHILLEEAKKMKAGVKLGDELTFPLETHGDFGRIAAQTAKQVILQKLREAERDSILDEYKDKEGEIVSGIVQRFERGNVYVDLGRATGIMFYNELIPGEHYRSGDRMRFLVLAVQEESRMPGIILSRSHPKFISKLFAIEVPEIADGIVTIKAIAREAGSRTKFAVDSEEEGIDPVGSCVGQKGTRVMAVSNELGNEKLDIIEWSEDPATFVANSLSPAKVRYVEILPRREARAFIDEDQLSLAIGKGGQNVRLAAKITGWKIDVRSQNNPEQVQEGGIAEVTEEETVEKPE